MSNNSIESAVNKFCSIYVTFSFRNSTFFTKEIDRLATKDYAENPEYSSDNLKCHQTVELKKKKLNMICATVKIPATNPKI